MNDKELDDFAQEIEPYTLRFRLWSWLKRFVGASALAAATYGLAWVSAWLQARDAMFADIGRSVTERNLRSIDAALKDLVLNGKPLPRQLTIDELPLLSGTSQVDDQGRAVDGWNHLLLYQAEGNAFTITSLGRDGRPGGVGIDCDRTNSQLNPPEAGIPFGQFWRVLASPQVVLSCQLCALVVFLLGLTAWPTRRPASPSKPTGEPRTRWGRAIALLALVAMSAWFAGFLSLIHLSVSPNH